MTTIQLCLLHTNAANMSAVWKYLKLSEKDAKLITSTKHRLRDCLALHLMSQRRRRVHDAGDCMMIEMASNDWVEAVNCRMLYFLIQAQIACKLFKQRCKSSWHQGSKSKAREKSARLFLKACANAIRATNIFPNSSESFINLLSTKRSTEVFLRVYAKIKAPSTFINVSVVILMLFYKKNKKVRQ